MRQDIGNNKIKEREKVKATEKKGIIIQVAQKIFSRYGLIKTTVDEIAKAARYLRTERSGISMVSGDTFF